MNKKVAIFSLAFILVSGFAEATTKPQFTLKAKPLGIAQYENCCNQCTKCDSCDFDSKRGVCYCKGCPDKKKPPKDATVEDLIGQ